MGSSLRDAALRSADEQRKKASSEIADRRQKEIDRRAERLSEISGDQFVIAYLDSQTCEYPVRKPMLGSMVTKRETTIFHRFTVDDLVVWSDRGHTVGDRFYVETTCSICGGFALSQVHAYTVSNNADPELGGRRFTEAVGKALMLRTECWNCAAKVPNPCPTCGRES